MLYHYKAIPIKYFLHYGIVFNKIRLKDKVVLTPNEVDSLVSDFNTRQEVINKIKTASSLDDVRNILYGSKQKTLSRK